MLFRGPGALAPSSRLALASVLASVVIGLVPSSARADDEGERGWAGHIAEVDRRSNGRAPVRVASADQAAVAKVATDATPAKADKTPAWETAKAERRSGFAMGLSVGAGLGASNGYPNDAKKIGRAAYYTESGLGLGTGSALWIGGALADWINFGFGFGYSNVFAKGSSSPAPLAFFHNDIYPLYPLKGAFRDLGATFELGLGFPKTVASKTQQTIIEGGGSSFIYGGVFWEPLKVWKLRMGPFVGAHYLFSESVRRPLALGGFRMTLYTAP